jgi:HIV Tat-specific factor 1
VTSIPLDADKDEIKHVFSKMGVIAEELDSGEPRIKMYEDDKGQFKGDALVVYFRPESVDLAVQMLDDTEFRLGSQGPNGNMRVQAADYSYKAQKEAPQKTSKKDLKKIIKKSQKMNNKLADWDDDDPQQMPETSSKFDKVVILKHMFTPAELEVRPFKPIHGYWLTIPRRIRLPFWRSKKTSETSAPTLVPSLTSSFTTSSLQV